MLKLILMSMLILCLFMYLAQFQMIVMMISLFIITFFFYFNNMNMISPFFGIDLMSFMLIMLTIWISFLMLLASTYLGVSNNKNFVFYLSMMMFLLIVCFSVLNLLFFYLFFESVLFPIVMIIFGWGSQPERLQAGFYMLMYTLFGSLPLLVMILVFKTSSLMYLFLEYYLLEMGIFFLLMILGFLVKIPVFFFHLWLPKAHVEAPISGSMILAGVLLKLGIYGIYRFKYFYFNEMMNFNYFLMILSLWGSFLVSIYCLFQVDIKSLIAYSSVCHMGIVFSGSINFLFLGSYGSLLLMIGHGLCSSGLFCLANLIYERFFTRSIMMIKGLMKIFPSLSLFWFMFSIVNMSAPLTMNLMGEWLLCIGILKWSLFFIFPIMMMIFMSACYSMYMYSYLNHGSGWLMWSSKSISVREYNLLLLHLIPLVLWFLKMEFFFKWI
uniref:NADH-ubiquinone oxidoreductase chain 4 n=1 Tax=Haemaphysalis longicornis TaxID=44386 RepID=A0A481MV47_HAELO|nr:NADH dehydrogenase subunit 4 [Haemaphysalis longicornis]QTK21818.1 NADH dehydrogenase subunit 4 [Haemaphysalis longicornis]UKG19630.1 NADH dehydrogenase subunit 4 [Haemaphysalis longicornis]UKG19708.1 NADH dehydrogenase subunit 4 [Haemaphysalis longicornis]UKG19721.1 NADH dehydrogenase subunit 4 [Haemaphysalis longicornis]